MDKPFFNELFKPSLKRPTFISGLPGFGDVGRIAARFFIEATDAKRFAELYSPYFPDYVIVNSKGICRLPRYEFYAASLSSKRDYVILTGDVQPSFEDVNAHYWMCCEVLDFMSEFECDFIVTLGGVPTPYPIDEVYVAALSDELREGLVKKGAKLYKRGRIVGATGLLLGLAKARGWKGFCLLGATTGMEPDLKAASSLFKFLTSALGLESDVDVRRVDVS